MTNTATFLGTGSSLGVPLIGCPCEICTSDNPKNKRLRSSMLLEIEGKRMVIDSGPDFRMQALRENLCSLDGVIFTHAHHDHVAGIDDLRVFSFRNKEPLPCLASDETALDLEKRYFFMFNKQANDPTSMPRLRIQRLDKKEGEVDFLGVPIQYFSYEQIGMEVTGIRIGTFAYVTDIKKYDESIIDSLVGVKTLVISALRFTSSHMHLTVDEAVDFIKKVKCEKAYLTHISHEIDHEKANACLPTSVELAYDGLKIII